MSLMAAARMTTASLMSIGSRLLSVGTAEEVRPAGARGTHLPASLCGSSCIVRAHCSELCSQLEQRGDQGLAAVRSESAQLQGFGRISVEADRVFHGLLVSCVAAAGFVIGFDFSGLAVVVYSASPTG